MAEEKTTEGFDANFNMRCYEADRTEFYKACEENGEPDGATVVRRMMSDYVEGAIAYIQPTVQQEDK